MKTILVTGATGTIGKATALELAKTNNHIILVGRSESKLNAVKQEISKTSGNNNIDIISADLSEPKSVRVAVDEIKKKYSSLDAIVNIAAVYKKNRVENSQKLELMFATNHLGPFLLTNNLLDLVKAAKGRIVTVSAPSFTNLNFDDLQGRNKFSGLNAFGASKMMNLLYTFSLAKKLNGTGVTTNVLHPGLVKSEITSEMPAFFRFMFKFISGKPDKAARTLTELATSEKYAGVNGKFFGNTGKEIKANKYAYDEQVQEKLWTVSDQLTV
jgi:retinol dehydrogenase 14